MTTQTYHGSCLCGAITFEADIDFAATGTGKCNCMSCRKRRWWTVAVKPENFRAGKGADLLTPHENGRSFCPHCGITPYEHVPPAEWNDGERYSVNVASLDEIETDAVLSAPVQFMDGLHDNWWEAPKETRHL